MHLSRALNYQRVLRGCSLSGTAFLDDVLEQSRAVCQTMLVVRKRTSLRAPSQDHSELVPHLSRHRLEFLHTREQNHHPSESTTNNLGTSSMALGA